jgi:glutamate synthase (NADPH/NADH) small chain
MGDITGFLKIKRKEAGNRPVIERIADHSEIEQILNSEDRMLQASRCMDCGVPFCHWSCPVDNLIPEWNDLLYRGDWKSAYRRLSLTNNFPEFTGRICPAPCEHGCVLNITEEPVTIRENEVAITERAFAEGFIRPEPPVRRTGRKVAVIGSGPAGLAAADLLNKAGHEVTVFEREARVGGLLRYGVPDFKLSKAVIDRRVKILAEEGIIFKTGVNIGKDYSVHELREQFDAVCIATGATHPRDLKIEGRDLRGIHYALDFLSAQNRINSGEKNARGELMSANGKRVVVIGGGDTGSDCVGTAIRQQAASVTQIEIMPEPPLKRTINNPWPYYAKVLKTSTSHEEGCTRLWAVSTVKFTGEAGAVSGVEISDVGWEQTAEGQAMRTIPGSSRIIGTDMILLALGFEHKKAYFLLNDPELHRDNADDFSIGKEGITLPDGVFDAGDAASGPSLIVRAIASGRKAAEEIHMYLTGRSEGLKV